jgi:hypothetical protein
MLPSALWKEVSLSNIAILSASFNSVLYPTICKSELNTGSAIVWGGFWMKS